MHDPKPDKRSIGERWYEAKKRKDDTTLVLVDSDTGRVWVLGDGVSWFRDGPDAEFTSEFSRPMPDDVSENFAAITGEEAEKLVREAAAVMA